MMHTSLLRAAATSLLLLLALAPPTGVAPGGVLTNGDFELGLTGWTTSGSAPACSHGTEGTLTDKEYRGVDGSTSVSCGVSQSVAVLSGTYIGAVDVHVHSGTVQLTLRWLDGNGNDLGSGGSDTSQSTGFDTLSVYGTAPQGTTTAVFSVSASGTADYHADDAHLTPI